MVDSLVGLGLVNCAGSFYIRPWKTIGKPNTAAPRILCRRGVATYMILVRLLGLAVLQRRPNSA